MRVRHQANVISTVCIVLFMIAILVASAFVPAQAADLSRKPSQLAERHWTKADGLPAEFIWGIHQSEAGYLWLATDTGLARFDGMNFQTFGSATHEAFRSNDIRDVTEGTGGIIWAASVGGGLLRLDGQDITRFDRDDGLVSDAVYSVLAAQNGDIWVGTASGACRLRDDVFRCWTDGDGIVGGRIVRLAEDQHNRIWFASVSDGVSMFDDGEMHAFGPDEGLVDQDVTVILADPEWNILVGTLAGNYYRADPSGIYALDNPLPDAEPKPFNAIRDNDGNTIIGMLGSIWQFKPEARRLDNPTRDIGYVTDLLEDRDGQLWAATSTGLYQFSAGPFTPFGEPEGIANQTFVVANGMDGSVWAGTEAAGLFRIYPDGNIRQYTTEDGMPIDAVSSLMVDADGTIFAGTFGGGLVIIQNDKIVKTITTEDGLAGDRVGAIYRDRIGHLWVGTTTGLSRLFGFEVTDTLTMQEGLLANLVRDVREDNEGRLLISGDNGITVVSPQNLEVVDRIDGSKGLSNYALTTTYVDERGIIWIGGRSSGLLRMDGAQLFQFDASHNVHQTSVMTITEDDHGQLWLGGRDGIVRISRSELDAVATGTQERVTPVTFSTKDGLRATRVSGGYQPASVKASDGRLWFATTGGLAVVDPARLNPLTTPLPITIDAVRADGGDIGQTQDAVYQIPAGTQSVQIDYAVPSINAADALRFHYRLGDTRWQEAKGRRTAFFTSLSPRSNSFEVAVRYDGQLFQGGNNQKIKIELFMKPLWYQTHAATGTAFILFFVALWGGYRFALRYYRRRHRHLEQLVDERTAALQSALSEVRAMSRIDILTGVANRRCFEERMREEWAHAIRHQHAVTIMMIDIDHFKQFNDSAGHQEGDHCLTAVAQTLQKCLREEDFVARYGGEEFAVLLSGNDITDMCRVAKRLQDSVRKLSMPHPGLDDGATVTVSAGFATADPQVGDNAEDLIGRADDALYRAKEQGRDRIVVDHPSGEENLTVTSAIYLGSN